MAATAPAHVHVPAWKRLGLQLKNQQPPDEPSHYPEASKSIDARQEESFQDHALNGAHGLCLPEDSARDGSVAKLGKRKAEGSALGDDERPSKKKLGERSVEQLSSPPPAPAVHVQRKEVIDSPVSTALQEGKPQGDPNYRSKKGKKQDAVLKKRRISSESHVLEISAGTRSNGLNAQASEANGLVPTDNDQDSLHQSTETDQQHHVTSQKDVIKRFSKTKKTPDRERASLELTPNLTRRKSVTFTPDTKTVDGNSASELFKAWAAQQKGPSADFTPSEAAQFTPPPKLHPANDLPTPEKVNKKDAKKAKNTEKSEKGKPGNSTTDTPKVEEPAQSSSEGSSKPSKADLKAAKKTSKAAVTNTESAAYLDYLTRYHTSRETWKFNKATQSNLLRDALNIFRIPVAYSPALKEYITGLQGAAARDRLHEAATAVQKEESEDEDEDMESLDDREARKAAHDDALRQRLDQTKRFLEEGNQLPDAAAPEPKRRLTHQRAQEILEALTAGAPAPVRNPAPVRQPAPAPAYVPALPRPNPVISHVQAPNAVPKGIVNKASGKRMVFEDDDDLLAPPPKPRARNRKRRTDVSDDDSSSSSDDSPDSDSDTKQIILDAAAGMGIDSSSDESSDDEEGDSDGEDGDEDDSEHEIESEGEEQYAYDTTTERRRALAPPAIKDMQRARFSNAPFPRRASGIPTGPPAGHPSKLPNAILPNSPLTFPPNHHPNYPTNYLLNRPPHQPPIYHSNYSPNVTRNIPMKYPTNHTLNLAPNYPQNYLRNHPPNFPLVPTSYPANHPPNLHPNPSNIKKDTEAVKPNPTTEHERRRQWLIQAAKEAERARNHPRSFRRRAAGFKKSSGRG